MSATNDAYVTRQLELEREMFRASAEKLRSDIAKAKRGDREDETPYANRLMVGKIEAVAEGVRELLDRAANGGRAMNRAHAPKFLLHLEPEVAAALALKGILSGLTKRRTTQRCSIHIGRLVEDELLWRTFEAQAPDEAKLTAKKLKKVSSYRHRRKVAGVMAGRAEIAKVNMTEVERLHVGSTLLEIVIDRTGMIELQGAGDGTAASELMLYVVPRPETLDWIERFASWYAAVSPEWWPTVVPPRAWSGPYTGGYYSTMPRPLPLVKNARRGYMDELVNIDMPSVYAAINGVQETAFKVDEWTLGVVETVWDMGLDVAGLPKREPLPLPAKPDNIAESEDARNEWKKAAAKVYSDNVRLLSRRMQFGQGVKMARRFSNEPAIYFPHQFDFRGRMYAVPLLSYQGPDWMKGLLRFANGKAIENEDAAACLMIQGANLWGFDKGTIDERMEWVDTHYKEIKVAGTDPLASYWWAEADNPWQFLQWCHEWVGFQQQGYGFVSGFICSADGTCNGLQHFSAMLRDPVGGAAVNLVPGDRPSDIYAKVAEVVTAKLRLIVSGMGGVTKPVAPRTGTQWAQAWLDFGIDRKITKRAVMTLPYGSTQYSTREFIEDAVREKLTGGKDNPLAFRTDSSESNGAFAASLFLAPIVWESIGEVVVAAREAMGWLKQVAKLVAKNSLPVTWRTPDGFPVQQAYYVTEGVQVRLKMAGTACKLKIRREKENEIDKRRQEQGVSPNFVHSCDGTALRQYIVLGKERGIDSFAVVHDSFGCVAADYDDMQDCLREAFVALYENHDVMEELRQYIASALPDAVREELPTVPAKGSLDLEAVKGSNFFFA